MKEMELKQAIKADIALLPSLDFDVVPVRAYYSGLLTLIGGCFWKMGLIVLLATCYVESSLRNGSIFASRELVFDILLSSFLITFVGVVMLLPSLTQYYLIKIHLNHRIQTGSLLVKKLKQVGWVFIAVFGACCCFVMQCPDPFAFRIFLGFSYFAALFASYIVLSMEMSRVGASVLFDLVNQWVNKK
ncbi:hypothetical protein J2N86_15680 (plasmid) [Legionella lytica]|uniref:Transmembrane protein n=1 Tax=Legionella lytica TaxID=96232 RepID=A0ABY4YDL6_9GAMM|nr:hypothetical protein [Legionella lytica]USQ15586.1 hypothetical protein J2N86_15680 [Legionella lytica]